MEDFERQKKYLVLILTYNEELHIEEVIRSVRKECPATDILIVDGESTDKTCEIARQMHVWVIQISNRLGIAGGMEAGLIFANQYDYDFLIRIDGDGQHKAEDILKLIQTMKEMDADMSFGSRFISNAHNYRSSFKRSVGNKIFSFLVSALAGKRFYDTTSGFQILNKKVIKFLCQIKNFEYSEVITLLLLNRAGFNICEVPVTMNNRIGSQSSFNFIRAFFYVFEGFLSLIMTSRNKA